MDGGGVAGGGAALSLLRIVDADFGDARVGALVRLHGETVRGQTGRGSAHALDVGALQSAEMQCWTGWFAEELAGVAALRIWPDGLGEVKSMHVAAAMRRRGVGVALLAHVVAAAREAGLVRVSLETGSWAFFAPAHAFYGRFGFVSCGPFGDYRDDPNSVFMTMAL